MQYKSGDIVVYGNYGICKIKDIKPMSFSSDKKKESYYILSAENNKASTYYIPVSASESLLRQPMTKDEIDSLLRKASEINIEWQDNRQLRADRFHSIISNGITEELVALISCIYKRKQELKERNKSISSSDEALFSSAEKMLIEEFSFCLNIPEEKVNSYIGSFFEAV